ncbi:MAG: glycosyltransferase family 39 protein [Terriglobales bacterium]
MDDRKPALVEMLTVAGFCAFLFFFGLGSFGLVGPDEPRYAQVAREMLARHEFTTPILYGQPWLEKPVLYYWRAMLAFRVFGVHDWVARLPSATFATALVAIIYFHMRRFRAGAQLNAALITASAAAVLGFARGASPDIQLAAPFAIGMLGWIAWHETGKKFWLVDFYFFMAVGTLAKGPVAPVLAGMIVLVFAALRRDLRVALRTLWVPGIALYSVVVLPWYLSVYLDNPEFFRVFIVEHNLARYTSNMFHHPQPFWYYLPVLLLGLAPWTVLAGAAFVDALRRWRSRLNHPQAVEDNFLVFLTVWAVMPILFFSISGSKLPGYILPAIPAWTLLTADYLHRRREEPGPLGLVVAHCAWTAVIVLAGLLFPSYVLRRAGESPASTQVWLIAAGFALLAFCAMLATLRRKGLAMARFVTLAPVIFLVAFVLRVAAPAMDMKYSTRPLEVDVAALEARPAELAVFEVPRDIEYGLAFYRDHVIRRYERGEIPAADHLVIAPEGSRGRLERMVPGRRVSLVGGFPTRKVEYFWVSRAGH